MLLPEIEIEIAPQQRLCSISRPADEKLPASWHGAVLPAARVDLTCCLQPSDPGYEPGTGGWFINEFEPMHGCTLRKDLDPSPVFITAGKLDDRPYSGHNEHPNFSPDTRLVV